jgi:hypothetical protein
VGRVGAVNPGKLATQNAWFRWKSQRESEIFLGTTANRLSLRATRRLLAISYRRPPRRLAWARRGRPIGTSEQLGPRTNVEALFVCAAEPNTAADKLSARAGESDIKTNAIDSQAFAVDASAEPLGLRPGQSESFFCWSLSAVSPCESTHVYLICDNNTLNTPGDHRVDVRDPFGRAHKGVYAYEYNDKYNE